MPHEAPPRRLSSPAHRQPAWLLALLIAVVLTVAACGQGSTPDVASSPAPAIDDEDDAVASALPPPSIEYASNLNIVNNSGLVRFDGRIDSEANRDAIVRALEASYPTGQANGEVTVDANAHAPNWIRGLKPFLADFNVPGAGLRFEADRIELSGRLTPDERTRLTEAARVQFPDARLTGLFANDDVNPAQQALASLPADAPAAQLESALNGMAIQFEPHSAKIDSDSLAILGQAGQTIASMPKGHKVEIGGHASPSGDPALDESLARQRAEAVKVQLIVNGVSPAQVETRAYADTAGADANDSVRFRVVN